MPLPPPPTRPGDTLTTRPSASPVRQDVAERGSLHPGAEVSPSQTLPTAQPARSEPDAASRTAVLLTRAKSKSRLPPQRRKLFVLDTNVLLHDSNALFQFQEHDIFLPMVVLEELDHQKKGMSEVARNARQVSRFLDGLIGSSSNLQAGVKLDALGHTEALGDLLLQTSALDATLPMWCTRCNPRKNAASFWCPKTSTCA